MSLENIHYIDSASIQVANIQAGSITASLFGLATTAITASQGAKAWGYFSFNGTTLVSNVYACSITRAAVGSYNVSFSQTAPSSLYCVQITGHSGSVDASATASIGWSYKHATNGFTMSFVKTTVLTALADVTTGSF